MAGFMIGNISFFVLAHGTQRLFKTPFMGLHGGPEVLIACFRRPPLVGHDNRLVDDVFNLRRAVPNRIEGCPFRS
ncbi:hypothetical protein D3C73_1317080 [compost metagenome]